MFVAINGGKEKNEIVDTRVGILIYFSLGLLEQDIGKG